MATSRRQELDSTCEAKHCDLGEKRHLQMTVVPSLQGSLQATFPVEADVLTQAWLQSGMTIQLMRTAAARRPISGLSAQAQSPEADAKTDKPCCIARGVLQADDLLDGVTRERQAKLDLLTDAPLFSAEGIRLGLEDASLQTKQVCR